MPDHYIVTDEDGERLRVYASSPDGARPWALDSAHAAETWAAWRCAQEADYPDERIALVTGLDGIERRFIVETEAVPTFHAREASDAR